MAPSIECEAVHTRSGLEVRDSDHSRAAIAGTLERLKRCR